MYLIINKSVVFKRVGNKANKPTKYIRLSLGCPSRFMRAKTGTKLSIERKLT